jgi:hypothetical protein
MSFLADLIANKGCADVADQSHNNNSNSLRGVVVDSSKDPPEQPDKKTIDKNIENFLFLSQAIILSQLLKSKVRPIQINQLHLSGKCYATFFLK